MTKIKSISVCFLSIFLCLFTLVLTSNGYSYNNPHKQTCTDNINHGKYYLNPNDVAVLQEGIFLKVRGNFFKLNSISYDAKGLYAEEISNLDVFSICPSCGQTMVFGFCTNSDCSF